MIMISSNFIFNFTNICVIVSFLTKLLTLGILLLVAVRGVLVPKLVILALRVVLIAKLEISGILSSIS